MSIAEAFNEQRSKGNATLIGFVTAGIPSLETHLEVVDNLFRGGVDILEIGIPFSDPIADGPAIQMSSQMALNNGVTPLKAVEIVKSVKDRFGKPVALLSYLNPIWRLGTSTFLDRASKAGVDGLIIPDLPYGQHEEMAREAQEKGISLIFLAAPTTDHNRILSLGKATRGFLYLVGLFGVTGAREHLPSTAMEKVRQVKELLGDSTNVAVGFGISRPSHVKDLVAAGADGVIVGSSFIDILLRNVDDLPTRLEKIESLASELKSAARIR